MGRGTHWWNEPPWWAWTTMVVCAVFLAVTVTMAVTRAAPQADAETTTPSAPPSETVASPSAAPATVQLARPADGPLRVLFAGDSITDGSYASTEDATFRGLTTTALEAGGEVEAEQLGQPGQTASEALQQDVAPTVAPHLLVVEYGTNDVTKNDLSAFTRDYPALLDRLTVGTEGAVLVCAGPWEASARASGFNRVIESACRDRGGVYRPLSRLFDDGALHAQPGDAWFGGEASDDFHPNDAGHRAIAATLLEPFGLQPPPA